jgi:putative FmdB family regulatory protein
MPTYDYRCAKCGEDLEVYQSFSEEPLKKHAGCGGRLTKVLSSVGIVLKGSGFYKTDNRAGSARGKSRDDTSSTTSDSSPSSGGSDSGGSDSGTTSSSTSSGDSPKSKPAGEKQNGAKRNGEKKSPVKSA